MERKTERRKRLELFFIAAFILLCLVFLVDCLFILSRTTSSTSENIVGSSLFSRLRLWPLFAGLSSYNLFLVSYACSLVWFRFLESPDIGAELAYYFFIITGYRNEAFFYQNFYSFGYFNFDRMRQTDIQRKFCPFQLSFESDSFYYKLFSKPAVTPFIILLMWEANVPQTALFGAPFLKATVTILSAIFTSTSS